jgi:PAS domain S-box-containing protein
MASNNKGNSRRDKLDLGASDVWYRELFEHGLGYLCTHTLDGTILTTNPAAAGALGYDPNELAGQPFERLLAPSVRHFFPQYLERLRSQGQASGVLRVVSKGGDESLWLYRNIVVDEPNSVPYVLGYAQDITDLRNTILSERQAASDYRALVEHAGYGIYRATMEGQFLMVNPALMEMLGYQSEEDLMEANVATDVYADDEVRELLVEEHRIADRIEEFETKWRRKDGKLITVALSGRLVRNSRGGLECYEMFAKDVSEQRALEEQLRHAQKMELVGQLTGGMAHDFNNLLTVILANAALIGAALPANAEGTRTDLGELEAAARRGGAMIKRLLSFSRRVQFPPQSVDIGELLQELVATLRRLLPETIEIEVENDLALPQVQADPGAVEQIVVNLATNARDAMPDGGILRLEARHSRLDASHRAQHGWGNPGQYVRLSATDSGTGMDDEVKVKIFEPFFTTKEAGHGTGLGMPMIYGLMKQHGGFVDVESERDKGTTVQVYFPATTEKLAPFTPVQSTEELAGGTETILVVEDEEPLRRAAQRVLERFGYRVLLAPDGEEGLQVYHDNQDVGLVITDVMMPKMNGSQLHRAVREGNTASKFLFISGYNAEELKKTVNMDPTVPFMQKPWTPTEFLTRVREVLDEA